jgi:hypothetical protein
VLTIKIALTLGVFGVVCRIGSERYESGSQVDFVHRRLRGTFGLRDRLRFTTWGAQLWFASFEVDGRRCGPNDVDERYLCLEAVVRFFVRDFLNDGSLFATSATVVFWMGTVVRPISEP